MATKKFTVLAFDPGLTTTGWSLLEGNTSDGELVVLKIGELHPGPVADHKQYREETAKFDKRTITLALLREELTKLFNQIKPDFVTAEDIFINMQRPQAFSALCMWVCTVRTLCRDVMQKYLVTIPTKICKQVVTNSGSNGKLSVQQCIAGSKHVHFKNPEDLIHMSEHQADSIAVGIAFAVRYRDLINKQLENNNG